MKAAPILQLLIDGGQGGTYTVEAVDTLPHERRVWRLTKLGAARGYVVTEGINGAQGCECPGHRYRGYCKHVIALRELKLLTSLGGGHGTGKEVARSADSADGQASRSHPELLGADGLEAVG